jgi:hypothetical protein
MNALRYLGPQLIVMAFPAILAAAVVAFGRVFLALLAGQSTEAIFPFAAYLFTVGFAITWMVLATMLILRLRQKAAKTGVTFGELGKLTKDERKAFQRTHGL